MNAATGKLKARRGDNRVYMKDIAAAHKQSLASLLAAFTDGKIDQATRQSELEDEKRALRAELLGVRAISGTAAQAATKAFFDVLETAALNGIGGLL